MIYSGLASEFGIVQQKAKLLNAQIEDEGYRLSLFDGDEESGEGGTILYLLLVVERWCPNQNNNNNNNRERDDATTVLPESANRVKALALSERCKMRIRRNPPFRSLTFLPLLFLGLPFCSRVNEETMMYGKTASLVRTASRSAAARRQFASEPKMHKAKDFWADLKAKRPIDHDEEHVRTTVLNCKFFEIPNSLTTWNFRFCFFIVGFPPALQQGNYYWYFDWRRWYWSRLHVLRIRSPAIQTGILEVNISCWQFHVGLIASASSTY